MSLFRAHGEYDVRQQGDIVFLTAYGAMNGQAAAEVGQVVLELAKECPGSNWAILVDTQEFELGTPDFQDQAKRNVQRFTQMGLRCSAHVVGPGNAKRNQIELTMPKADSSYQRRYFDNTESALAWLEEQGFSIHN